MKNILIPTGYMSSGSSAITNIVSEFDGYFADYGTHEYVFLHCPNGLFDLEDKLLVGNNAIRSDEAMHSFHNTMKMLYNKKYWWVGHYNETFGKDFLKYTEEFMESITTLKTTQYWYYQENTNFRMAIRLTWNRILKLVTMNKVKGKKPLLYPEMWLAIPTAEEFYDASKVYLDKLFHMIGNDKRALILDQFLLPFNLHRYENYFNDHIKVVVVERDPRDVFLLNKYVHIASGESVPYPTDVVHFCKYYKRMRESEKLFDNPNILRINFESLVYDYDASIQKIMNLLELDASAHVRKFDSFNPDISINNTQVFTNRVEYEAEVKIIEQELSEYLFDFPYEREANQKVTF